MTTTGSYVPTKDQDAAAEAARLRAQAQAIFAREDAVLRAAGLGNGGVLLDVGCGPGHWLAAVNAAHRPALALGVERDGNHVRAAAAASGARVVRGDALQLPLADDSVDAVTMRLVLRHLPSPALALAQLVRVVRPGGHVAVLDADDGGLLLHEAPASFPPL